MAADRLPDYDSRVERRVLASGASADALRTAIGDRQWGLGTLVERSSFEDSSAFLPTVWTFGFIGAIGVVVAALVVVALAVYVDSRQRRRSVASALLRRMGLGRGDSLLAVVIELTVILAVALISGTLLGWLALGATYSWLDALPDRTPSAILRYPLATTLSLVAVGVIVVAALSGWSLRAADRSNMAEVLRDEL